MSVPLNFIDLARYHVPDFVHIDARARSIASTEVGEDSPVWTGQFLFCPLDTVPHEVAHLCIASEERRRIPDYGFGHNPDTSFSTKHFVENEEDEDVFASYLQLALMKLFKVPIDSSDLSLYGPMPTKRHLAQIHKYRPDALPEELWDLLGVP